MTLALFVVLNILDIWTTHKALKLGKREANPLLNWLFERFKPVPIMIAAKIPGIVGLWFLDIHIFTVACCAFYVFVVVNNFAVIRRG